MITVKTTITTKKLNELLLKLKQPQPALEEIGKNLKQSTQARIRDTKLSPSGRPFAPWSFRTLVARQKDGTVNGGILYRTGKLFNSIQYQVSGQQVEVGADSSAPYARYLQYGTMKMPARPFVGFSDQDIEMIRKVLQQHLRKP